MGDIYIKYPAYDFLLDKEKETDMIVISQSEFYKFYNTLSIDNTFGYNERYDRNGYVLIFNNIEKYIYLKSNILKESNIISCFNDNQLSNYLSHVRNMKLNILLDR